MSEKKLSIFRPVYSKVGSHRCGAWLWRNFTNHCDVRCNGESIYHHIHTLIWFLVKWDHCEYGMVASRVWFGRMEIII